MKKSNILLGIIIIVFFTSYTLSIVNKGNEHKNKLEYSIEHSKKINIEDFDKLKISGNVQVRVVIGDTFDIWYEKRDDSISFNPKFTLNKQTLVVNASVLEEDEHLFVSIKMPNLSTLSTSKNSIIKISKINTDSLSLESDDSRITINNAQLEWMSCDLSNNSSINMNHLESEQILCCISDTSRLRIYNGHLNSFTGKASNKSHLILNAKIGNIKIISDETCGITQNMHTSRK